ncbi:MAG: nuclear transport factor 2 family protein [Granulosicoccus sp.]
MSEHVSAFFDCWQLADAEARREKVAAILSADVRYDDPRTPQTLNGIDALNDYLSMFSANAPGWSATVLHIAVTAGVIRATVEFGGSGPDGNRMVQLGQYFVEMENDLITRFVGFAGTGTPEQGVT